MWGARRQDGVSGKLAVRPELDKALEYLREGDVFVITRLSRAMRSLKHMIALTEGLQRRGVGLVVLKQAIDTTAPQGRLVFHILASIDAGRKCAISPDSLTILITRGWRSSRPWRA